jgi:hypothetical protein
VFLSYYVSFFYCDKSLGHIRSLQKYTFSQVFRNVLVCMKLKLICFSSGNLRKALEILLLRLQDALAKPDDKAECRNILSVGYLFSDKTPKPCFNMSAIMRFFT